MRVTTAFNRMLGLPGAWVRDVAFGSEAVIVTVVLSAKNPVCSGCGARGLTIKEHRVKRWRHLDLGAPRCVIECRLLRLYCPGCGDVYEAVPWARAGSSYTRDFEDLCAWLAQQMSQTQVTRLMRIGWESVANILERVVAEKLDRGRLDGLAQIGCDEVSYGADHKFLTCVVDHHKGRIVWAAPGRNAKTLQAFFDALTDEQKASITAVSIDMSAGYEKAIRNAVPHAEVCFDPFHVVQLGSRATDQVRRAEYNKHGRSGSDQGKWIKGVRYSLLKDPSKQTTTQLLRLCDVQQTNKQMFRAALLYGELRYIYKVPTDQAQERLDAWLAWAQRSRLKPFVKLARTIRKHKPGVLAAVRLGINNGRLEALNSKVRLISHRAYGFHSADALIAMIYLCCAGIQIALPHR
ncbi:MAG TPA: ISL3 family transposase [Clostridia bacterium]|nr:ISL3 family transposase [Clostridia bacterium]